MGAANVRPDLGQGPKGFIGQGPWGFIRQISQAIAVCMLCALGAQQAAAQSVGRLVSAGAGDPQLVRATMPLTSVSGSQPIGIGTEAVPERACLGVTSAYGQWLDRVDLLGLVGAESGFYGNPQREMARIENARYVLLARAMQRKGLTDMTELSLAQDPQWSLQPSMESPLAFRQLGEDLRLALKPCLGDLVASARH